MSRQTPEDVTQLLHAWSNGNRAAFDRVLAIVYAELRRLAHHYMRRERKGHTLQTTALINEAYLRLSDNYTRMRWDGRAHFLAVAAQAMRRILVEQARKHDSAKRGGEYRQVSIDEAARVSRRGIDLILAVEMPLQELESLDPRRGRIVELRFYGGLTVEETANVLGISTGTVKREWRAAKAWLHRAISEGNHESRPVPPDR